ncbi:MAG: hypothetical protein KC656_08835 [Myxococcales bacterium]|nr:hypothetical protein [Myxococcales bacterium]
MLTALLAACFSGTPPASPPSGAVPMQATPFGIASISGGPMAPSGGYGHGFTLDVTRDPAVQALLVEAFDATTVGDGLTVRQWVERKRAGDVASLGHLLDVERRRDTTLSTFDAEGLPVHSFWVDGLAYSGDRVDALYAYLEAHGTREEYSPPPIHRGPPDHDRPDIDVDIRPVKSE